MLETTQADIFKPVFAMFGLTIGVWFYLYFRRITFFNQQKIDPDTVTAEKLNAISPPQVSNPSDNFKNLFEVPVIFYAFAVYLFVSNRVSGFYLWGSWIFVLFRLGHSLVHCTFNRVTLRFALYMISTFSLWIMIAVAAFSL